LPEQLELAGTSVAEFREGVARDLRAEHVLKGVFAEVVEPVDGEVRAYYDANTELFRAEGADAVSPFDEVRDDIGLFLVESRRSEAMARWIESLKAEATIVIVPATH
jgi:hypothetical protein